MGRDDPSFEPGMEWWESVNRREDVIAAGAEYKPGTGWVERGGDTASYDAYRRLTESGAAGGSQLVSSDPKYANMSLEEIATTYGEFYTSIGFADDPGYRGPPVEGYTPRGTETDEFGDVTNPDDFVSEAGTLEEVVKGYETTEEFKTLKAGFLAEMQTMGLGPELSTSLWDWVEGRFVEDASFTTGQAMIEIYEQKAFKTRFPGITEMRKEDGRRDIPTPQEYLTRERLWATHLTEYGMTALGADLNTLVAESYIRAIGEGEFVDRLQAASKMIYEAPEAVKTTFGDWYGPRSDAALMATFLDPDDELFGGRWKDWVGLEGDVAAAEVGGWSRMYLGLDAPVSEERSRAIAGLGWHDTDVWAGLDALKAKEDLFIERIGEVDYQCVTIGYDYRIRGG